MFVLRTPIFFPLHINLIVNCLALLKGISCVQITEFYVPVAVKVDEDHRLSCHYQLSSTETLYFLRWYKDGNEFFRYMPKETPSQRVYNVSGVNVKMSMTNSTSVMLTQVDPSTSGLFRCEVSAEAPSFETADREAEFNVIEKPLGQPFIMVSRDIVGTTANETIIANCSGPENRRHSQLSWVLLSTPIPRPSEKHRIKQYIHNSISSRKLNQTVSVLHLPVEWIRSFLTEQEKLGKLNGLMQGSSIALPLYCTSHILGLFQQSDVVNITIQRNMQTTLAPVTPESRDASNKSAKSSSNSKGVINTKHGAFTNASLSSFPTFLSWLTLANFMLASSLRMVYHCSF